MPTGGRRLRTGLVFALALVVMTLWWGLLIRQAESSIFARVPLLDEQFYLATADRFASAEAPGVTIPEQPFFMSPLYPQLLKFLAVGTAQSDNLILPPGFLRPVYWFQMLCWLGTALLLRLIAGRMFQSLPVPRSWLLWIPSLLFVFYRPLVIYSLMVLVELPLVFLVTLLLFFLSGDKWKWTTVLGAGMILGLAILLRGSVGVLAVFPLLKICRARVSGRTKVLGIGVFLVSLGLVLAPPIVHNSRIKGSLASPSLNGGLNLYLGNGPAATGFYMVMPCDLQKDPACTEELARRLGRKNVSLVEADALWAEMAWQTIKKDPGRILGLWIRKMHLHLQAREISQLTSFSGWGQEVPLIKSLVLPWWFLVGLAGIAMAWLVDRTGRRVVALPLGVMFALMSFQSLFFVVSRYRLILVPMLCLLGLAGILGVLQGLNSNFRKKYWLVRLVGASAFSVLLVIPWGMGTFASVWPSLTLANHAQRWALLGSVEKDAKAHEKAAVLYQESIDGWPTQPGPWLGYAAVLRELGRGSEAEEVLQDGIQKVGNNLELRRALIAGYLTAGRDNQALDEAVRLLRNHPDDAETLHNSAILLAGRGQMESALATAQRLVKGHPDLSQGYVDLGILLVRVGRIDQAREVFLKGLQVHPEDEQLKENLSQVGNLH